MEVMSDSLTSSISNLSEPEAWYWLGATLWTYRSCEWLLTYPSSRYHRWSSCYRKRSAYRSLWTHSKSWLDRADRESNGLEETVPCMLWKHFWALTSIAARTLEGLRCPEWKRACIPYAILIQMIHQTWDPLLHLSATKLPHKVVDWMMSHFWTWHP